MGVCNERGNAITEKNGTWVLAKFPKGAKPVGCKWIFKKKEGIPGVELERFKARLVAKGF